VFNKRPPILAIDRITGNYNGATSYYYSGIIG
jgi:hypothetical protein